ncbi:spore germination protein [Paenibacillus yanchengensis]|uniref:Spore germination protein n=1 Tax=Paenibacillus yanchengensis TaxID=2035833 RepID=A0ABW4YLW2_9BACL
MNNLENDSSEQLQLSNSLHQNIHDITTALGNSSDMRIRRILMENGDKTPIQAALIHFDGMINEQYLQRGLDYLLKVDMATLKIDKNLSELQQQLHALSYKMLPIHTVKFVSTVRQAVNYMLQGEVILLLDQHSSALALQMSQKSGRSVEEPSTETIIRGPREGFVEDIGVNTVLIRQRIRSDKLRIESTTIGRITQTKIEVIYLKNIADEKTVLEVHRRLNEIDIDGVLESGYIEEFIQDTVYTPFPTIFNTERPDVLTSELLEGRVAILVDGTPFALIVPAVFVHFFQAAEDYYHRSDISSLIRLLRFISFFIALFGPSVYIAITTFHQEMIPAPLLLSLSSQREGVPFPAFIEAFIMEIAFEILREAGVRMPRAIGQAVSIVGTLVIGTAAVDAGIVSAAMVIVVSITAISSFAFPAPEMSSTIRIIRFPMMILGASFGLFGILIGILILAFHLVGLRSFGIPYMSPFAPLAITDLKDTFIRLPIWFMRIRPKLINQKNKIRMKSNKNKK